MKQRIALSLAIYIYPHPVAYSVCKYVRNNNNNRFAFDGGCSIRSIHESLTCYYCMRSRIYSKSTTYVLAFKGRNLCVSTNRDTRNAPNATPHSLRLSAHTQALALETIDTYVHTVRQSCGMHGISKRKILIHNHMFADIKWAA